MKTRITLTIGLVAAVALCGAGCNGHGFDLGLKISTGDGTTSSDGGSSGGGSSGGGTTTSSTPFAGIWIASYGDDQSGDGSKQYAVRISVTQNASTSALSGTGTMFRVFRSGSSANDTVPLSLTGNAQGNDAQLIFRSTTTGKFDFNPVWTLRAAGSRLTGIYQETDINAALVVSGHAVWNKVTSGSLSDTWASGYSDSYAATGLKTNDTSAAVALAAAADGTVTGDGLQVIQRESTTPDELNFSVAGSATAASQLAFRFDGSDLTSKPMHWWGFYTPALFVGAYEQSTAEDILNRFGHATWYTASGVTADNVTASWVTSFGDSAVSTGAELGDYVMQVTLSLQSDAAVTGSAIVLNERDSAPEFKTYTVENGTITGSRVRFDVVGFGTRFSWDLNLAYPVMTGCYQQFNTSGTFLSRGVAEWRTGSTSSLVGTWTAAYVDTLRLSESVATQLSRITIASQTANGVLSGSGTLQFPPESSARTVAVSGTRASNAIELDLSGTGLAGPFTWHFRQAGEIMFGSYTNYTTTDLTEARGHAIWFRSSRSTTP